MRKQNLRKVKWDKGRNRAYVLRDGVRYWAPDGSFMNFGDDVVVLNPTTRNVAVKGPWDSRETWRADATSTGDGG